MNDIMHVNEKLGPGRPDIRRINAFCDHVKQCGFIDLGVQWFGLHLDQQMF